MTYTQPLLLMSVALVMTGLAYQRSPRGRLLGWCGVAALLLISWPFADWLLARPLEGRYPVRPFQLPPGVEAIVVLGSAVAPPQYERPYPLPDKMTFDRCAQAAWIYHRWGPLPVLACEGRSFPPRPSAMHDLLRQQEIPDDMIWVEGRSRSTHENAVFSAAILRAHHVTRLVLVTDAQSMPRAAACFRKEGMAVTEAPCDLRTLGPWREELLPHWHAIRRNEITLHESLGLAWYWFRGWI
jgi:uncharacterized SAM-binding protein YcdF (DUF218 family)